MMTWVTGDKVQQIRGLSTDTKPTEFVDKDGNVKGIIPNGTVFFEMDTSKVYMFDYDGQRWIEVSNVAISI